MFTGIVQELATVAAVDHGEDGSILRIDAGQVAQGLRIGDSVSVDGVCLTAIDLTPGALAFEAMHETLERSTLGRLPAGDRVNLEAALRAGEPLGGHVVQGHVDGVRHDRLGACRGLLPGARDRARRTPPALRGREGLDLRGRRAR